MLIRHRTIEAFFLLRRFRNKVFCSQARLGQNTNSSLHEHGRVATTADGEGYVPTAYHGAEAVAAYRPPARTHDHRPLLSIIPGPVSERCDVEGRRAFWLTGVRFQASTSATL